MTTFHMETDTVRALANQLKQAAESIRSQTQSLNSFAQSVDWLGPSRDEFVSETQAIIRQVDAQTEAVVVLAGRIENEIAEWGQMATASGSLGAMLAVIHSLPFFQKYGQRDLNNQFSNFETPKPDKGGMVLYPDKWITDLLNINQQSITATEKEMLEQLNPAQQLRFYQIYKNSLAIARKFSNDPGDLNDGVSDAFRHIYWNAQLTREFGADWAKQFTDAHECREGNTKAASFMDLSNNALGIDLVKNNPDISDQDLVKKITDLVKNGNAIIVDPATQTPIFSNQNSNVGNLQTPLAERY